MRSRLPPPIPTYSQPDAPSMDERRGEPNDQSNDFRVVLVAPPSYEDVVHRPAISAADPGGESGSRDKSGDPPPYAEVVNVTQSYTDRHKIG